jgi:hypothetical protein
MLSASPVVLFAVLAVCLAALLSTAVVFKKNTKSRFDVALAAVVVCQFWPSVSYSASSCSAQPQSQYAMQLTQHMQLRKQL